MTKKIVLPHGSYWVRICWETTRCKSNHKHHFGLHRAGKDGILWSHPSTRTTASPKPRDTTQPYHFPHRITEEKPRKSPRIGTDAILEFSLQCDPMVPCKYSLSKKTITEVRELLALATQWIRARVWVMTWVCLSVQSLWPKPHFYQILQHY